VIDTRQLEMFAQVVEAGSFSGAARALHCSQPAISQQMRALERVMGGPLFLRVGRRLQLTDAGKVLARHAAAILGDLAVAHRQVQAVSALDLGTVRVCAFPSANATLVPKAAAKLRAASPRMRLELSEAEPPDSFAALRRAECDIVIAFHYDRPEPPARTAPAHADADAAAVHAALAADLDRLDDDALTSGMVATPLLHEQWELLVPISHPMVDHGRLDAGDPQAPAELATLRDEIWIAGCPTCRVTFTAACERAGFVPDIVCSTDDNLALQSLVAAGLGVTLVPRLVSSFVRHPRVVAMPVTPAMWRHVAAYTWPDLQKVAAIRDTIAALRSVSDGVTGRSATEVGAAVDVDDLAGDVASTR
jgi:DNA-binding transcriptional LysR family regulator